MPSVKAESSVGSSRVRTAGICITLAAITLVAYWRVQAFSFVIYDDPAYLTQPREMRGGLNPASVKWALISAHHCNWHPVTTLSYLFQAAIYGLDNPRPFHTLNVAIHTINAVVLFLVLQSMTWATWRSAFVAAMFAVHPLHVESVAWISERKDVLSGLFMFLTLGAYVGYARRGGAWRYGLTLGLFALGLASKPMLVTLPFVLLLVDYWPLKRPVRAGGAVSVKRLLVEKTPMLAMSLVSSVITFVIQRQGGAMISIDRSPLPARLANAVVAYFQYLGKMVWPVELIAIYPYSKDLSRFPLNLWPIALLGLIGISVLVVLLWRRRPYLATGWFWYLGMLVPVIGVVQVGQQSIADRYTYLPLVGVFIAIAWGATEALSGRRWGKRVLGVAAIPSVAVCVILTRLQAEHWRDSETLFLHCLKTLPNDANLRFSLGAAYRVQQRFDEAIVQYEKALQAFPNHLETLTDLPLLLHSRGRTDEAFEMLQRARRLIEHERRDNPSPQLQQLHSVVLKSIGLIQMHRGELTEAEKTLRESVELDPQGADPETSLAVVLIRAGKLEEAKERLTRVLSREPKHAPAYVQVGMLRMAQRRFAEAEASFVRALELSSGEREATFQLGMALLRQGRKSEARDQFVRSAKQTATDPRPCFQLGVLAQSDGEDASAIEHYRASLARDRRSAAGNNLSWLLATAPDDHLRDGREAVRLAEEGSNQDKEERAEVLDTLAAAYAENGEFEQAVTTAETALSLARRKGEVTLADAIEARLSLYRARQPYREPAISHADNARSPATMRGDSGDSSK